MRRAKRRWLQNCKVSKTRKRVLVWNTLTLMFAMNIEMVSQWLSAVYGEHLTKDLMLFFFVDRFNAIRCVGVGRRSRPFKFIEICIERIKLCTYTTYSNGIDDHAVELARSAAALDQTAGRTRGLIENRCGCPKTGRTTSSDRLAELLRVRWRSGSEFTNLKTSTAFAIDRRGRCASVARWSTYEKSGIGYCCCGLKSVYSTLGNGLFQGYANESFPFYRPITWAH